jgi:topoisomerase IV subunit B
MATPSNAYSEGSIRVLKGLEPVKQRPGMYTRTDNPLHIIQEVLDNAADEALAGFGKKIKVTLHTDGSVSVEDDGRGIPFGLHPEENAPVVELVFTRLHAGGKFDKGKGGAYSFSGGLHGVGVSVTNALSTRLEVTCHRDGQVARLAFGAGDVIEPLVIAPRPRATASRAPRCAPGPMPSTSTRRAAAGRADPPAAQQGGADAWRAGHAGQRKDQGQPGLAVQGRPARLPGADAERRPGDPAVRGRGLRRRQGRQLRRRRGRSLGVAFTEDGQPVRESYVNLIPTSAGGTHDSGLRDGLFQAVKASSRLHALLPKGVKLLPEDVFARASYVLSAKVLDPQFQGQIKERLNSRDAVRLVGGFVRPALELWLNQHVDYGKKLAELAIKAAQSRQKAGQKVEKAQGLGRGRAARQADRLREPRPGAQRAVPGRGRLGRRQRQDGPRQGMPGHAAAARQGAQHLGGRARPPVRQHRNPRHLGRHRGRPARPLDTPDLSGLRYGKVCILSDADVDGSHIQVLLLTLFFRHFPKLIETATCTWRARRCSGSTCPRAARSRRPSSTRWTKASFTPSWTKPPRTA